MYTIFNRLESVVKSMVRNESYSEALDAVKNFVISSINDFSIPVQIVGSRRVDELCELIGDDFFQRFFSTRIAEKPYMVFEKRIAIVCTTFHKNSDTSTLISNLIKAHPGYECTIILTKYSGDSVVEDSGIYEIDSSDAVLSICPAVAPDQKLHWLIQEIINISAARIFLLNNHYDSVIISAARPFVETTNVIFYHQADCNMCLGVHLGGAIHMDTHNVGFYNCRHKEGLDDNAYVPLTIGDSVVSRVGSVFMSTGELTTCSSGPYQRFRDFYVYSYPDLLVGRLKIHNGRHFHIGDIPPPEMTALRKKLADEVIDADRFVHIPSTPSLWRTLVDQEIDLFIGSFPVGDARTTIEVMGAGIPMLMPENYLSRFLSSRDIAYPDAFMWKYPADFTAILQTVTPKALSMHAARSRAHYMSQYNTDCVDVERKIDAICAGLPTPAPYDLYTYQPDYLDRALHFSHISNLATSRAVQLATASVANGEEPSGNGLAHAIRDLHDKVIGEEALSRFKAFKSYLSRQEQLEAVKRLSTADRDVYHAIKQRSASIGFDSRTYLEQNPDVAQAGADPLLHYVEYGRYEGREPAFFTSTRR